MKSNLKLVSSPEHMLSELLPRLDEAQDDARRLSEEISAWGRRLAKERGVAFIRFEHLKREFGQ